MTIAFTLELDVNNDGTWSQDETSKMLSAEIERGRANALAAVIPGRMTLKMNNRDGRYSPLNTVISNLDHDLPIRLYATWTTPTVTNLDENPAAETNADGYAAVGSGSAPTRMPLC